VRTNIVQRARRDLRKRYVGKQFVINLGSATDPYQPVEKDYRITRRLLQLLARWHAATYICTKSDLVLRDLDLIREHPRCWVAVTLTSLRSEFQKVFEPNAPPPENRVRAIRTLTDHGVFVVVRISPLIPGVNDDFDALAELIATAAAAGAQAVVADFLKLDRSQLILYRRPEEGLPLWKRNLSTALQEWVAAGYGPPNLLDHLTNLYYRNGDLYYGWYLPSLQYRYQVLKQLRRLCDRHRLPFAPCRMGVRIRDTLASWRDTRYRCACTALDPLLVQPRSGNRSH